MIKLPKSIYTYKIGIRPYIRNTICKDSVRRKCSQFKIYANIYPSKINVFFKNYVIICSYNNKTAVVNPKIYT